MARKKNSIDTEVLKKIYRTVSRIRHFEEQGIKLYRQGLIKGYFHPYLGQEGIAAGVVKLVGTSTEGIFEHTQNLIDNPDVYKSMQLAQTPYGNGTASDKICKFLEKTLLKEKN